MEKESISATIEKATQKKVKELCKKENRSFSSMVDILLQIAIPIFKKKK